MSESMRELRIRPAAISHNVSALRAHSGTTHTMLVVKANGYGHGAVDAARAGLDAGADWLGTADITEALELRAAQIDVPVLAWLIGPDSPVTEALEHRIDLGVSSLVHLEQVAYQSGRHRPAMVHLEVDSGMGRGGVSPAEWPDVCRRTQELVSEGKIAVRGVFSHLAATSAESDRAQGQRFTRAVELLSEFGVEPEIVHLSSSLPAARTPELRADMVRLGIAAYGVPVAEEHHTLGLTPAMRLSGTVTLVKRLPEGHGVGYDHTYTTRSATMMAIVPLGYADGIPRHGSSVGPVSLHGQRFVLSGRVSMDQVTIDMGDAEVAVGDRVVFWGDPDFGEPHVMEWAQAAGTNAYELLTRVGPRVRRVVE